MYNITGQLHQDVESAKENLIKIQEQLKKFSTTYLNKKPILPQERKLFQQRKATLERLQKQIVDIQQFISLPYITKNFANIDLSRFTPQERHKKREEYFEGRLQQGIAITKGFIDNFNTQFDKTWQDIKGIKMELQQQKFNHQITLDAITRHTPRYGKTLDQKAELEAAKNQIQYINKMLLGKLSKIEGKFINSLKPSNYELVDKAKLGQIQGDLRSFNGLAQHLEDRKELVKQLIVNILNLEEEQKKLRKPSSALLLFQANSEKRKEETKNRQDLKDLKGYLHQLNSIDFTDPKFSSLQSDINTKIKELEAAQQRKRSTDPAYVRSIIRDYDPPQYKRK